MNKRIFIAINLPGEVRNALGTIQAKLRDANPRVDVKWVRPEIIHLTLHFLGWMDESRVEEVKMLMGEKVKGVGQMQMRLGQLGCFPDSRRPRVVWVELGEGSGALRKLHIQLRDTLFAAGFKTDTRPWQAHLTLGRLRTPQALKGLDTSVHAISFRVSQVDLMESILHPDGPQYTVLASFPQGTT